MKAVWGAQEVEFFQYFATAKWLFFLLGDSDFVLSSLDLSTVCAETWQQFRSLIQNILCARLPAQLNHEQLSHLMLFAWGPLQKDFGDL